MLVRRRDELPLTAVEQPKRTTHRLGRECHFSSGCDTFFTIARHNAKVVDGCGLQIFQFSSDRMEFEVGGKRAAWPRNIGARRTRGKTRTRPVFEGLRGRFFSFKASRVDLGLHAGLRGSGRYHRSFADNRGSGWFRAKHRDSARFRVRDVQTQPVAVDSHPCAAAEIADAYPFRQRTRGGEAHDFGQVVDVHVIGHRFHRKPVCVFSFVDVSERLPLAVALQHSAPEREESYLIPVVFTVYGNWFFAG